jgi:hypothetical protein
MNDNDLTHSILHQLVLSEAELHNEKLKIKKQLYKKYFSEVVKKHLSQGLYKGTELQDVYDEARSLRKTKSQDQYYFITICPYEDLELEKVIKVMENIIKKKWFTKYIYVYEQRQDQDDKPFFGIHIHMIVHRETIAKSDVIREIYNTCKNIVSSQQSIDVKLLNSQHDLDVRLNYILGQKSTPEKRAKQEIDKIFREQNGLQKFYSLGDWDLQKWIN